MNEDLKLEINRGIGLITLNRPEALNTFNAAIREGLGEAYPAAVTRMIRCG